MKNRYLVLFLIIVLILCVISGCDSEPKVEEISPEEQACIDHEDSIFPVLYADFHPSDISVEKDGDLYNLSITVTSGKVSSFGDYVIATKYAFENEILPQERGYYSVTLLVEGTNPSLIRFSSDLYSEMESAISGLLSDNRSGEVVFTQIDTFDDLASNFPAVNLYVEEKGCLDDLK